ncbi:MAG: hypothetical protein HZA21_02460 [Nitrospirae bacterium]|nr:hypothetical protein [Nitrospirota bacterium]
MAHVKVEVGLEAKVEAVQVNSPEDARRCRLTRSPTICINGEELFLDSLPTAGPVVCDCGSNSNAAVKKALLRWMVLRMVGGWRRH